MSKITVYDNGGETCDRYTVITDVGDVYGMSINPKTPNGFNLYIGDRNEFPKDLSHLGKIVDVETLPEEVKEAIKERCTPDQ